MQTCSGSGGVSRLHASQLAFPHDPLVRFVRALYSIFEFDAPVRQALGDLIRTARDITTDSSPELYDLTDMKFAGRHGGAFQRKSWTECTTEKRGLGVGFATKRGGAAGTRYWAAAGFWSFWVGSLHEFEGWFLGRVPLDHLPSANITIGTAAVSDGQFGIAHDVHRPAVPTDKVSARGECWGAHRGIICALALQE
jgi:hypothetical protein